MKNSVEFASEIELRSRNNQTFLHFMAKCIIIPHRSNYSGIVIMAYYDPFLQYKPFLIYEILLIFI